MKRFQEEVDTERKAWEFRARPVPKTTPKNPSTSTESPVLFGLRILNQGASSTPVETTGSENVAPQVATPRDQGRKSSAYVPHSTIRAKKRASFDERRALHEIEQNEEEERRRKAEIKQRRAQLYKLRESI